MAEEPVIRSSAHPQGGASYHRNNVYAPMSCGTARAKVANLERQINALKDEVRKDMQAADMASFASGAILTLTVVKETCMSFVDMAATLGPNEKMGAVVKGLADMGMAGAEYSTGQSSGGAAFDKALGGAMSAGAGFAKMKKADLGGRIDAAKHAASTMKDGAAMAGGADGKDKVIGIGSSNASLALGQMEEGFKEASSIKGQKVVKGIDKVQQVMVAMSKYDVALNKAFDLYLAEEVEWATRKRAILAMHKQVLDRMIADLKEAKEILADCLEPDA